MKTEAALNYSARLFHYYMNKWREKKEENDMSVSPHEHQAQSNQTGLFFVGLWD